MDKKKENRIRKNTFDRVNECEIKTLAGKLQAEKLKEIGQVSRLLRDVLNGQGGRLLMELKEIGCNVLIFSVYIL
jgi:hypothetical protein